MTNCAIRTIAALSNLIIAYQCFAQADIDSIYGFELKVDLKATPVKDQYESETCWAYAATSFVESELIRMGRGEFDLSEKFFINRDYYMQAIDYVRWNGKKDFGPGAEACNVLNRISDCGIMLETDYGCTRPNNTELDASISKYINSIVESKEQLSTAWLSGVDAILNNHLGTLPDKFTYNNKSYTPIEFRDYLEFNANDYVNISSFNHHPIYKSFILESPDNWDYCKYYNVTIDEMTEIAFDALNNGYTVLWSGDFSEDYLDENLIVVPIPKAVNNMIDTNQDKLNQYDEDDDEYYEDPYPNLFTALVDEVNITPELRQTAFDNYETTDDHCMHLTGYLTDRNGIRYFKAKNSWGSEMSRDGYLYFSEAFFRYKTLNITIHKNALPTEIKQKLNL